DFIRFGSLTEGMASFLEAAIKGKLNIIVSGGTGSGKTTLLNVLSSFIPEGDRIVTIEDAAELKLHQRHVVSLETRPANIEGKGEIAIRTLLKNALRMRPDRIVVGECRGGEALDMLQAMNTGHDGSLTTLHSNSPRDCIARLETLVMYSGVPLPSRAIRAQIASAVHLIVQLNRLNDGSRKITRITEIAGMEGEIVTLQDIFTFDQKGMDANRKVIGEHKPTGFIPRFIDSFAAKGIEISRTHFQTK
ncbi:MAG: ATPase, T2SS/T4P/T4SS family, partial [bacterium]|nr:ATPase, T2SS/T4P/T4SS family [bacterium]